MARMSGKFIQKTGVPGNQKKTNFFIFYVFLIFLTKIS